MTFENEITTTSVATKVILHRMGYKGLAYQGALYWTYDGETLVDRRHRMERGE